jgi:acetyl-CoA synthetase
MSRAEKTLDTLLQEERRFPPPDAFAREANVHDPEVYERADADPEGYWAEWAERLHWFR